MGLGVSAGEGGSAAWAPVEAVGIGLVGVDSAWRVVWANAAATERVGAGVVSGEGRGLIGAMFESFFEEGDDIRRRLDRGLVERGQGFAADARVRGVEAETFVDVWARRTPGEPARASGAARASAQRGETALVLALVDAGGRAALRSELSRLRDALASSERARERLGELRREMSDAAAPPTIIGSSAGMRRVLEQAERVAPTGATVLIHGETGSGKDLVARLIHARSVRGAEAFIAVNCAALPETLIESELFGHERGAFTGADRQRLGKFELADRGTLFLDEIAELSPAAQAKLLRVLQGGAFERVGGSETITADVRLIAATHRDLARQVERGRFREDLFYRLNVFRIDVPPLRDRREDLRALIAFLHERHARRMGRPALPLSERSVRRVLAYRWPGNIRELENAVERATLLSDGPELEIELPDAPTPEPAASAERREGGAGGRGADSSPRDVLLDLSSEQLARIQIMHALETSRYRVFGEGGAAARLGVHPQTLLSRMDKYGIPRPRAVRRAERGGDGAGGGDGASSA